MWNAETILDVVWRSGIVITLAALGAWWVNTPRRIHWPWGRRMLDSLGRFLSQIVREN